MNYFENEFVPTEENSKFLEFIEGDSFPWYYQPAIGDLWQFGHALMKRDIQNRPIPGIISSQYYQPAVDIFSKFCTDNSIEYSRIFRVALNKTFCFNGLGGIHIDHEFKHNNFLLYVNEWDKGCTYLFDNDNKLTDTIQPKKNKAVTFPGIRHCNGSCAPGQTRTVLVVTYV